MRNKKCDFTNCIHFKECSKTDQPCISRIMLPAESTTQVPKNTNPKDAIGIKKVSTFVIPSYPQFLEGIVFMSGARKYGAFNWRASGVRFSVYFDALQRHINAFKEGEDIDSESGVSHLAHARACLAIILDSMKMGNWVDDRPPKYPDGLDIKDLNDKAAKVIERYPNCAKPFTELLAAEKIAKLYGGINQDENKS